VVIDYSLVLSDYIQPWNYVILTAANDDQAAAYEAQIQLRRNTEALREVGKVLVVADPQGRRAGSGGSTIECLLEVLRREGANDFSDAETILRHLRILIVHAGGDSRRLPAYSHCGKIFVPLPGDPPALFDRLVPAFMRLPPGAADRGQIVVAAGDALILFDAAEVGVLSEGITALGSWVAPQEAARHGVLCPNSDGSVRLFLQKPDLRLQAEVGAISADGRTVLDIGVMSLDAGAAVKLLAPFCRADDGLRWRPAAWAAVLTHGIDLYREICCALGTEATLERYLSTVRISGSKLDLADLSRLFAELHPIPLHCQMLRRCEFLHFGSSSELITSGLELVSPENGVISIGNEIQAGGTIEGHNSWVEGCRLRAPLRLGGRNVVVRVDVSKPLEMPKGGCLDLTAGFDRLGRNVWFVRYYGVDDSFKHSLEAGATFCGQPLIDWLRIAGVPCEEVWSDGTPESERTLWNARLFPAEAEPDAYPRWHWMLTVDRATPEQVAGLIAADRYSAAEIAVHSHSGAPKRDLQAGERGGLLHRVIGYPMQPDEH
jgi:fucokinase